MKDNGSGGAASGSPLRVGVFSLAMMNVVAVASLRDLPQMATYGLGAIFFYAAAALFFFIPVSLVAAELASAWPERGGVYVWVREAFGPTWGFAAVFLQWFQNLCWFPVVITFAAASLAFAIAPAPRGGVSLAENKWFIVTAVLTIFWGCVLFNLRGLRLSSKVAVVGAFSGVVIPGVILIVLAFMHLAGGNDSHLALSTADLIPDLGRFSNITFGVSVFLAFAGMEMTAAHAREVVRPSRTYPLAIGISAVVIVTVFVFGALSVAVVVPAHEIVLQTGVVMALKDLLEPRGLGWLVRIVAAMLALGIVGSVGAWIVGPSKGLLAATEDGYLTRWLSHTNRHGVPGRMLCIQGLVVSAFCLAFVLQPTVAAGYFMLSDLTIQLYLMMYLIMFVAAIYLRFKAPRQARPFRIPGGLAGMLLVAGMGIVGSLFCIVIGFFPPDHFATDAINPRAFVVFLAVGVTSFCILPLVLACLRRRG